jgi:hypothetical protein
MVKAVLERRTDLYL